MKPKDNSRLTLLAYSDWLEENNQIELAEEVRRELFIEYDSGWMWEARRATNATFLTSNSVGIYDLEEDRVEVGMTGNMVGSRELIRTAGPGLNGRFGLGGNSN